MHLGTVKVSGAIFASVTACLISGIIVSGAYPILFWCVCASLGNGVSYTILDHCDLTSDTISRIIVSGAYLLYYLR